MHFQQGLVGAFSKYYENYNEITLTALVVSLHITPRYILATIRLQ